MSNVSDIKPWFPSHDRRVGMGAGLAKVIYDHFNKLLPVFESKPPKAA